MASLSSLILQRQKVLNQVVPNDLGDVFYTAYNNQSCCTYLWSSPGTGVAVIELWGASGSGARMCCCSGHGIPGNSGAYSRKRVRVDGTSCVCGFLGGACHGNVNLCYSGRSLCSVACFFNTSNNMTMTAQGGYGGFNVCTTSTAVFCCLRACNFCTTSASLLAPSGSGFCGLVCNVVGPNSVVAATATGGDVNISGGISCTRIWECSNFYPCAYEFTVGISAGIISADTVSYVKGFHSCALNRQGFANTGRQDLATALNSLQGVMHGNVYCWAGVFDCGCYEWSGCTQGTVGVPGFSGFPCCSVRSGGSRGGAGAVKITYYQD